MNEPKHPRAVTGLIILAVLFTMMLGLRERRGAPLATTSPISPVDARARTLRGQNFEGTLLAQLVQRAQLAQRAQQARDAQPSQEAQLSQDAQPSLRTQERMGTRAFWIKPWPWIVAGLGGFGLLAWGLFRGMRRMERD